MRAEWTVLIADDEPAARRGVRHLLTAFPEFAVSCECRNGREVLAALDQKAPDVVFLDVQMPGIDGLEVIRRRTPECMPPVVFLTAYDQFAISAFEAQALDYLVKPVSETRFAATMKRLIKQLGAARAERREEKIAVTTSNATLLLNAEEIDWIEAEGNYARVWAGQRSYLLREPVRLLERRMRAHGFLRAHRRALVRLGSVREVLWTGPGAPIAILECGARISISRRRCASFAAALTGRVHRGG
jgi:two-component system LytT family response regulator